MFFGNATFADIGREKKVEFKAAFVGFEVEVEVKIKVLK